MKKVISIARVELAGMFYSPIAWIALILFIIQVGMDFSDKLIDLEAMQFIGRSTGNLTNVIFSEDSLQKGLLRMIQERMFLFIPLLTMGSMSREIHSGSIKLLLSSPIRLSGIILGKFLAMMVVGLLFIIILLLYMLAGIFTIENMDWSSVMVALLGIYLLICAYAAIGIFISSLTRYQIMAAISTFILLGVLSYMGRIWQNYDLFREVTHNISISGRLNAFIDGLIITREVIYFLGIIAFFLSLTMLRLWFDRKSASISMRVAGYSLLCAALIIVGFISSRPVFTGYWDFTSTQRNTMSEDGQKMIKRLKGPLDITTYANLFDSQFDDVSPASRYKDLNHLEYYQRFRPDMKINYVYYYDSTEGQIIQDISMQDLAALTADGKDMDISRFLTPAEIKKCGIGNRNDYVVRELKNGNKKEIMPAFFIDFQPYASEAEYMASIKRMLDKPGELRFVTGHNEKSIFSAGGREYRDVFNNFRARHSAVNQGFHSDTISLTNNNIPEDLTALVIADPKLDFAPAEIEKLKQYINRGGNLLIFGEPRKREIINSLIAPLGLTMMEGMVLTRNPKARLFGGPEIVDIPFRYPLVKDDPADRFIAKSPGGFEVVNNKSGFDIEYTGVSEADSSWFRPVLTDMRDSLKATFSPSLGDSKKEIPVLLKLTRNRNNRQQKIMVVGDADLLINDFTYELSAFDRMRQILKWFTDSAYPVKAPHPFPDDNRITANKDGLFYMKWFFIALIPAILFVACTIVLIRRKRK